MSAHHLPYVVDIENNVSLLHSLMNEGSFSRTRSSSHEIYFLLDSVSDLSLSEAFMYFVMTRPVKHHDIIWIDRDRSVVDIEVVQVDFMMEDNSSFIILIIWIEPFNNRFSTKTTPNNTVSTLLKFSLDHLLFAVLPLLRAIKLRCRFKVSHLIEIPHIKKPIERSIKQQNNNTIDSFLY